MLCVFEVRVSLTKKPATGELAQRVFCYDFRRRSSPNESQNPPCFFRVPNRGLPGSPMCGIMKSDNSTLERVNNDTFEP